MRLSCWNNQKIPYPFHIKKCDNPNNARDLPNSPTPKQIIKQTDSYDYGARYYNPKTSLWLSVDPLAEVHPSRSPYEYCASNPVVFIDPDGRIWGNPDKDEKNAKRHEKKINAKIKSLEKDRTDKVNEGKDIGDLDDRISTLKGTLKDINAMRGSKKTYTFGRAGSKADKAGVKYIKGTYNTRNVKGIVTLFIGGDEELSLHEIKHGGQDAHDEINLRVTNPGYVAQHEVEAYKVQYSYRGKYSYFNHTLNQFRMLEFELMQAGDFHLLITDVTNINQINSQMINNISVTEKVGEVNGLLTEKQLETIRKTLNNNTIKNGSTYLRPLYNF